MAKGTLTKGEYRVGTGFNPSGDSVVEQIKRHAASLIDLIELIPTDYGQHTNATTLAGRERGRLKALAQTAIEEGAMWAVKAATKD